MKIAVLTLPLHKNYGGILQAYALQTVLERMGHEVFVITKDRDVRVNFLKLILPICKHWIRCLLGRADSFEYPWIINRGRREREQFTQSFINKYIHAFEVRRLPADFPKEVDAIVVGSDQIWRKMYFQGMYECGIVNAFLKFVEDSDLIRIAYAASFGTDDWEYSEDETKECSRLLSFFNAVSVREVSAVDLCLKKLNFDKAIHVLDPTFLLEREDYVKLVDASQAPRSSGNMMCYVLDMNDEKYNLIERIAKDRHLKPFMTNSKVEDPSASQQERIQPPVANWLRGFMDADFVVTDSFHACVFSIIFRKPFVVIGNLKRGLARFLSLLSMFELNQNLIITPNDYNPKLSYEISGRAIKLLGEKKALSEDFLKKALLKQGV